MPVIAGGGPSAVKGESLDRRRSTAGPSARLNFPFDRRRRSMFQ